MYSKNRIGLSAAVSLEGTKYNKYSNTPTSYQVQPLKVCFGTTVQELKSNVTPLEDLFLKSLSF